MTCSGSVEIKDRNLYPIIATFLPFAYLTYFLTFVKRNKVGVIHEEMMLSQSSLLVEGTVEEQVVSELFECLRKKPSAPFRKKSGSLYRKLTQFSQTRLAYIGWQDRFSITILDDGGVY